MVETPRIRLDHRVIYVSDWERSNRFYSYVLGAELVRVGAGWSYRASTSATRMAASWSSLATRVGGTPQDWS